MSEVHVKEGESLDSALKRFKRSCAKAGVLAEVREERVLRKPQRQAPQEVRGRPQEQKQELLLIVSKACWTLCSARFFTIQGQSSF